ncbi:MAG: hypothetical protein J6Q65_05205, partial [Lentisphaeria bacterium]|nr:hypothetical protein [Lentisphaeria bacterium]
MIREDIYEPLSRYRDEFREKFDRLAIEKFEKLLAESGVDEKKNRRLIREILRLKAEKDAAASRHRFYVFLNTLFIALIIVSVIALFLELSQNWLLAAILTASFSAVLFFVWSLPESRSAAAYMEKMEKLIRQKTGEAWEQLRPLNRLYHWRITAELIEATVPRIQFDPYFTLKRLTDLKESFGWDDEYNSDKSVCFSHSGVINDNPFVLGSLKKFDWQKKTYEGYLEIHWTTVERDANGNRRTVHHSQTLYATVEKPIPVYSNEKLLIYGNDAAPELTFSRKPSKHSAAGDGFFASMSKKRELNRLKKLARNLVDDSDYTMMSNQEFELLFHSTDRSDEVQFRLLFTPLAQQQMVRLLKNQEVGFGDDFYFQKLEKINV